MPSTELDVVASPAYDVTSPPAQDGRYGTQYTAPGGLVLQDMTGVESEDFDLSAVGEIVQAARMYTAGSSSDLGRLCTVYQQQQQRHISSLQELYPQVKTVKDKIIYWADVKCICILISIVYAIVELVL